MRVGRHVDHAGGEFLVVADPFRLGSGQACVSALGGDGGPPLFLPLAKGETKRGLPLRIRGPWADPSACKKKGSQMAPLFIFNFR